MDYLGWFGAAVLIAAGIAMLLPYSWVNPPPFDSKNFKKDEAE